MLLHQQSFYFFILNFLFTADLLHSIMVPLSALVTTVGPSRTSLTRTLGVIRLSPSGALDESGLAMDPSQVGFQTGRPLALPTGDKDVRDTDPEMDINWEAQWDEDKDEGEDEAGDVGDCGGDGDDGDTPRAVLAEHEGQPGLIKSEWVPIAGGFLPGEVIKVSSDTPSEPSCTPSPVFFLTPPSQQAPLAATATVPAVTPSMPDSGVVLSMSAASTSTILEPAPVSAPAAAMAALPPLLAALGLMTPQKVAQPAPQLPMTRMSPSFATRALDLAPGSSSDVPMMHSLHLANLDLAACMRSVQESVPIPTPSCDSLTAELLQFADAMWQGNSL